ncbi:MAG: hypothetical protein WC730_01125 [Patescibacteria group bacterium]
MGRGPLPHFQRRSIRLRGYDYTQNGAYFLTLCTFRRTCLFGSITSGVMHLNQCGRVVSDELFLTERTRDEIELDAFVIMPNHVHVIVWISRQGDRRSPCDHEIFPPRPAGDFYLGGVEK